MRVVTLQSCVKGSNMHFESLEHTGSSVAHVSSSSFFMRNKFHSIPVDCERAWFVCCMQVSLSKLNDIILAWSFAYRGKNMLVSCHNVNDAASLEPLLAIMHRNYKCTFSYYNELLLPRVRSVSAVVVACP